MTGFGRGESSNEVYNFKVEIKAVNHRYNDIVVKMPRHISYLEENVKKIIKTEINRGKIDVYINLDYINESAIDIKVDIPLAKSYKDVLEKLSEELELEENIRLFNILGLSEIIKTERKELDEDIAWTCLKEALNMALRDIMNMKVVEGEELKNDMISKLDRIETIVLEIEERSPLVVLEYKGKLRERIGELLDKDINIDEDRIASEVAIFADKSNINEEIVRLKSHVKQFLSILNEKDAIGRKLDFLIQEMNREINTIGSKANDMLISQNVVEIKSELEKIREQVQNIE
ncbi:TIGR00255 family protein [Tissierella praeacuta DSM 18095]|uniref:TIGR00255 family protein n=2 Tax=Tissierella praeacuta TaxID=43131 RepID=A0A1M4SR22_9FIRM|nr:YicC/YloC family endoribonuclease [Tissierella praeacuta]SHE34704.1 TIGR00255 family protein [Tissierella praeacuta DSM 18095]SUP01678.1 YicC-like family, N-terminal region [Tissierella praeacuta]